MSDTLVDRARSLFEFLQRTQELRESSPRTMDSYRRDGDVLWLSQAPEHPAVRSALDADTLDTDTALLTVDRVPQAAPPEPEQELQSWLDGPCDDPKRPPRLRQSITVVEPDDSDPATRTLNLADHPHVRSAHESWLDEWQGWSEQEQRDVPARQFYNELFSAYLKAGDNPEELELVAGLGCLGWSPHEHPEVQRHLFTAPLVINFDDSTARLSVEPVESPETFRVELDMLEPGVIRTPDNVNQVREQARDLDAHPLDRDQVGELARRLVHTLDSDGEYRDEDEPSAVGAAPVATFAPAVILRKRSQRGLVEIFQTIVSQLTEAEEVPDGVIPLVDADHQPSTQPASDTGALVTVDDEQHLPMPVNDKQRQIVERVDRQSQVLVQGPPGTGKTHTAAALLSHLLAQGKRVLVTAQTDRALREVRDKLPDNIKPLSVSVVGTSREDMADLKVAVQEIATASHDHDGHENARVIQGCLDRIDQLRRQRATAHQRLVAAREQEVREFEYAHYQGTLAAIAERLRAERDDYAWLADHVTIGSADEPPLTTDEIVEWRRYLLDSELRADEETSRMRLDVPRLPEVGTFSELVDTEAHAATAGQQHEDLKAHAAFEAVMRLDTQQREQLQRRLHHLADEADALSGRREQWMSDALQDVRSGRSASWQARGEQLTTLIEQCAVHVDQLGTLTKVELPESDAARLVNLAREVGNHLAEGGKIKTSPDGTPRIGAFSSKVLKQAEPLFTSVRVDGLPPTSSAALQAVQDWFAATKALAALEQAWPENVTIPAEDTLHERLQWHRTELQQLHRVLRLAGELQDEQQQLGRLGLPAPDWNDLAEVRTYTELVDAAAAEDAWKAAAQPLRQLQEGLDDAARWSDAAPCVEGLRDAVATRDREAYAAAHARLWRLHQVRQLASRRDELGRRLADAAPALFRAIAGQPADDGWETRLGGFAAAWTWESANAWVLEQDSEDVNALQDEVNRVEGWIRDQVEILAARRAWDHAASPERLGGSARADLEQYAYLVRRAGKLTGQYAAQRKAEIRRAMDRCRPSVPVWIMPIYRIAEQLKIQPDMFDVVIVDEASQAGMEASFLQYLAAKVVVIGDDKQVSPAAVGVDQQKLRDLAGQYLAHDRYRDSWQDPQRSLFDEAKMRYGGLITLTEHRRCVPEIIGFSNRIAYEPDNIRLVPVRQYGADRLEPIKAVHLPDGYAKGTSTKINPVEADAIVDEIEKCLVDPAYENHTFGVISLLGAAQARHIENKLLERIGKQEWNARSLRCGDAPDFQGSERDVIFLSMVAAPDPGQRLATLTRELYVQRYNVAVSRAKDQVWLFHSIDRQSLNNPDDMRFQLLDYCYGVIERGQAVAAGSSTQLVPEDRAVPPFDSLFEQRVHNRIIDRGYTVVPQYTAIGYSIDLVVIGGDQRLAVECDGDYWHGPDRYEQDLARQRELERCGWRFFRVRESAFNVDPAGALRELWNVLEDLDTRPGRVEPAQAETAQAETEQGETEQAEIDVAVEPVTGPADFEPDSATPVAVDPREHDEIKRGWPGSQLRPYRDFPGEVPVLSQGRRPEVIDGIRRIVEVEGPIVGSRLHGVYVRSSGGQRVTKQITAALNPIISAAVRQGVLVEDNPLGESGIKHRTYRLPEQEAATIRALGPRTLDQVPPAELAAIMRLAAHDCDPEDDEALMRGVLDRFQVQRLTKQARAQLEPIVRLVRET